MATTVPLAFQSMNNPNKNKRIFDGVVFIGLLVNVVVIGLILYYFVF